MSRGGRGGGNSATGVRAIASVLGIARHEVGAYTQLKRDPPPLYPPLASRITPLEETSEYTSPVDFKKRLHERLNSSQQFSKQKSLGSVALYTDKYKIAKRTSFEPNFSRVPTELNWTVKGEVCKAKRRKLDDESVAERLAKLEEKEKSGVAVNEEENDEEETEEKDAERRPGGIYDDDNEPSDDDYLEEANDYVENYFDNGERYLESDDNLDDENYF